MNQAHITGKRARQSTERFEPTKQGRAASKKAAKAPRVEKAVPAGINPRFGKPWQRGPYKKDADSAAKAMAKAAAKAEKEHSAAAKAEATVASLKLDCAVLKAKSEKLEELLAAERASKTNEIERAKAEAKLAAAASVNMAFQRGLKAGADLATGKTFTIESPIPFQVDSALDV